MLLLTAVFFCGAGCGQSVELATGSEAPEGGVMLDYTFVKAGVFPGENLSYPIDLEAVGYLVVVDLRLASERDEEGSTGENEELDSPVPVVRFHLAGASETERSALKKQVVSLLSGLAHDYDLDRVQSGSGLFRAGGHGMTLSSVFVSKEVNHLRIDLFGAVDEVEKERFHTFSNDLYRRFQRAFGDRFYVDVLSGDDSLYRSMD